MLVLQPIYLIGSQLFLRNWLCFWELFFKNSSFMLFALKFSLVWLSFVHSIKICFIEYWFLHGHFGGGSSLRKKEWVSRVYPMCSRIRVASSLLVLLGSSFLSFKIGCIGKSLLWRFWSLHHDNVHLHTAQLTKDL